MNGPITLTVEGSMRWWVKPVIRGMQHVLNVCVWFINKYGVKVTVK